MTQKSEGDSKCVHWAKNGGRPCREDASRNRMSPNFTENGDGVGRLGDGAGDWALAGVDGERTPAEKTYGHFLCTIAMTRKYEKTTVSL